jgi:hypothetical protein
MHERNRARSTRFTVGLLVTLVALSLPAAAAAAREYRGTGTDDPKTRVRIVANRHKLKVFQPRNFLVKCDDPDRTRGRAKDNGAINAKKLSLKRRRNGRRKFEQHVSLEDHSGNSAEVDLVGSFDRKRKRARGRFKIEVTVGEGQDTPAGTRCTTGVVRWKARQRPA